MTFWYLATPYSRYYSRYPGGIHVAFDQACYQASILIRAGVRVYCPIAHTHPIAMQGGLDPHDHAIWLPADRPFIDAAHGLIVCKMAGWEESKGVKAEIAIFEEADKPVLFMELGHVPRGIGRVVEGEAA
jgi:hypothetical protein